MDPSVRIKLRSMFDDGLLMYSDLDERNTSELSKFDASVALEILEHYCSGDLSQVRNRRAYLAGAIRRRMHMARDHYQPPPLAPDGLPVLHPHVQRRFDEIKQLSPKVGEVDARSMDALAALPPSQALMALDRFGSMDFSSVRNPSALFMSIVRNILDAAAEAEDWGPPPPMGRDPYRDGYRDGPGPPPSYRDGPPHWDRPPRRDGPPPHYDAAPPPPPPRRPPPAAVHYAALPQGTILAPGVNGGLVIAGSGGAAVAGGLAGVQAAAATAAPQLLLAAAAPAAPQYVLLGGGAAQVVQAAAGAQVATAPGSAAVLAAPQVLGVQQAAPAVPEGVPADWAAGRQHYGAEQGQLGVRVAEFHDLSPFAQYVHPSPALKLQSLWDGGNELVSMLDDKVWQVLAEMPAPEALAAIQEAADALDKPGSHIRNINAFFMAAVKKVWGNSSMLHRGPGSGDYHHQQQRGPPSSSSGRDGGYGGSRGGGPYGHQRGGGGGGGDWGGGDRPQRSRVPAIHLLPPEQRLLAERLCAMHAPLLREEHFDEGVIDSLARLSHEEGVAVLKELGQNSMSGVRNMPAYIMGIAKRHSSSSQRGSEPHHHSRPPPLY